MTSPVSGAGSGDEAREPIAVFLLDDHEVVRRGVAEVLEDDPGITVAGEAGSFAEALVRVPADRVERLREHELAATQAAIMMAVVTANRPKPIHAESFRPA